MKTFLFVYVLQCRTCLKFVTIKFIASFSKKKNPCIHVSLTLKMQNEKEFVLGGKNREILLKRYTYIFGTYSKIYQKK